MTWVGAIGHDDLDRATDAAVRAALYEYLATVAAGAGRAGLIGVCRLDTGGPFAEIVLELGGRLEVVEPGDDWVRRRVSVWQAERYVRLRLAARRVHDLSRRGLSGDALDAAAWAVVADLADELVAVWDGSPCAVADIVRSAWSRGQRVTVVWPEGAARR